MLKELYDSIQQLEKELAIFDETTAADAIRLQFYPKKALLAETYYNLGQYLERVQPLESVYCYWKSYVLTSYFFIMCRLFQNAKNQFANDLPVPEKIPSFLEHVSPETTGFLKALQYWLGIGETQSYKNAFQKLKDLENHPDAIYMLGRMHEGGLGGLNKSDGEAVRLYRSAAKQGQASALLNLGWMHEQGRGGLQKSDVEAVQFYRMAAEKGNAAAQNRLGLRHEQGLGGLNKSDVEAVRLYRLAANQGHAAALFNFGVMYEQGRGNLEKNDVEAVRLYRLVADKGYAAAQNNLGTMYEQGRGNLEKNDGEAVRLYRLAADKGNAVAQKNLIRMYKKKDAAIPIRLQEIKYLSQDRCSSLELGQAVDLYLSDRLLENNENLEMVYCIRRILIPGYSMGEFLKTVPSKKAFEFLKAGKTLSKDERENFFLEMLLFYIWRCASPDEEQEAIFNDVCKCICLIVEVDRHFEPVRYNLTQRLIDEVVHSQSLSLADKRKTWSFLLKQLGHNASSVFLKNKEIVSYCIQDENGYFLYQRLIGYFEKDEFFLHSFREDLLKAAATHEGPLEETIVFSNGFRRDVPVETFLELLGRPLVRRYIENPSDTNFENLMLILNRFPNLKEPSFFQLYPLLLSRLQSRLKVKTEEKEKSKIKIIANYFLQQSQYPEYQDFFRDFSVDFLQAYFRALYTGVYPEKEIQERFDNLQDCRGFLGLYDFSKVFFFIGDKVVFSNAAEILMKAYLALQNPKGPDFRLTVEKEIFELIHSNKVTDALRINLLYFLYQHNKQPDVIEEAASEIWRLKLDVSLIETNWQDKTPVSKIYLLLDLVMKSIEEKKEKLVEDVCSEMLALHYLDEIDNELKKWKSMFSKTLTREERVDLETNVRRISEYCNGSIIGEFIQQAQEIANTSKKWFFMQTAAQQFVGRFKQLQHLSMAYFGIMPEQPESPHAGTRP